MVTHALSTSRADRIPSPEMHLAGKVTVVFLVLLGIGALAGGLALTARPDGSVMQFDVALLAGSPFADYFVPGLILGGLFGIGSFVVAAMGIRRVRLAPFLAFAIGCAQMIWISVELAFFHAPSLLQPTCFAIGLVIAVASVAWGRPTFVAWRAAR